MRILVDMNLSPEWVRVLQAAGHQAEHLADVGDRKARDTEIMAWARQRGAVVFTHDLDFGSLLAVARARGPSVIQVRTRDVTPSAQAASVLAALRQFRAPLEAGALVSVDAFRSRVRLLPLD